jgi:hypothetical protein
MKIKKLQFQVQTLIAGTPKDQISAGPETEIVWNVTYCTILHKGTTYLIPFSNVACLEQLEVKKNNGK